MRKTMTVKLGVALLVGLVGAAGLSGCGRVAEGGNGGGGTATVDEGDSTPMALESQVLAALGFEAGDLEPVNLAADGSGSAGAAGSAAATASAEPGRKGKGNGNRRLYKRLRLAFGKRALHGEVVVQTENGTRTLVAQRGEVTAITATTITVKSTDGYVVTWTFADKLHVFEHRTKIKPEEIKVGTQVGVAGFKDGDTTKARAIVIPNKKKK